MSMNYISLLKEQDKRYKLKKKKEKETRTAFAVEVMFL